MQQAHHGDEIRERAGGGGGGRPGAGRRLRTAAARGQARRLDRIVYRPGRSRRRPDSGRRRPEGSGGARGQRSQGQRHPAIPERPTSRNAATANVSKSALEAQTDGLPEERRHHRVQPV